MNNSWDKYIKPDYDDVKITESIYKEVFFFGFFSLIFVLGVLSQSNIKNTKQLELKEILSSKQLLNQKIELTEAENSLLETEILLLNKKINKIIEEKNNKYLEKYEKLLATKEINGEGIVINLTESSKPITSTEDPNSLVIHNEDLLFLINELWTNKAKAISVNNQRITSKTSFMCIGSTILINKTRIYPPFIIKAIGDPELLSESISKGYIEKEKLKQFGIQIKVTTKKYLTVRASKSTMG